MITNVSPDANPVVELRRYTLHPGRRQALLDVFERHLIDGQEEAGIRVGGTYTDEDDPDVFVWWRGFAGHAERVDALRTFYDGPVWAAHRDAANATMVDSDNVLLLRHTDPAHPAPGAVPRAISGADRRPDRVRLGVYEHSGGAGVDRWLATEACTVLSDLLGVPVATWCTDPTPDGFPRLSVRADHVFVWAATFHDARHRDQACARLDTHPYWTDVVMPQLRRRIDHQHTFQLAPTARSRHPHA